MENIEDLPEFKKFFAAIQTTPSVEPKKASPLPGMALGLLGAMGGPIGVVAALMLEKHLTD